MRRFVLSLVVLSATALAAYAQEKSPTPDNAAPDSGSPDSATGGLGGVYGPPKSAPGQLRGVYGPSRALAATPLSSRLSGSANSSLDNVPSVSIPGVDRDGQSLPEGVQASPMPDRPGYGRARVNGRLAIIDLNGNRIVQFLDSSGQPGGDGGAGGAFGPAPGQLRGVYGAQTAPLTSLSSTPAGPSSLSSTLAGSSNSSNSGNFSTAVVPGATLPVGVQTTPSPYGAGGYGQALVNGRTVLFDMTNNRIVEVLH